MAQMRRNNSDVAVLIDGYIQAAMPFARPILSAIRDLVKKELPEAREEWKWNAPNVSLNGPLCMIWSFKKHAAIHFFRGAEMKDPHGMLQQTPGGNINSRFIRFEKMGDFNEKVIATYLKEAARVNKNFPGQAAQTKELEVPEELLKEFSKSKKFKAAFDQLKTGERNSWIKFIAGAKLQATRLSRVKKLREEITIF